MHVRTRMLALAWAGLATAAPASATLTVFTDRLAFQAASAKLVTDGYQDLSHGLLPVGPLLRTAGPYAYRAEVENGGRLFVDVQASGARGLSMGAMTGTLRLSEFAGGLSAIGADFFATGSLGGPNWTELAVRAVDFNGEGRTLTLNSGGPSFLGFVTDSGGFLSLRLVAPPDAFGIVDGFPTLTNLSLATAVPEPQAWSLMASALALGALRRRARSGSRTREQDARRPLNTRGAGDDLGVPQPFS